VFHRRSSLRIEIVSLTNFILVVAVELYLKALLPAILATGFRIRAQSSCSLR
jgi:hypothetical protein